LVLVSDIGINTFLGFAPNLFAAITLVFWQTYITASKPWLTLLSVIIVLFSVEFIQLFMTTQTADVYDLFATVLGSLLAIGFVILNNRRKLNN
jgi:glycopeptide antibiotics resistance protein